MLLITYIQNLAAITVFQQINFKTICLHPFINCSLKSEKLPKWWDTNWNGIKLKLTMRRILITQRVGQITWIFINMLSHRKLVLTCFLLWPHVHQLYSFPSSRVTRAGFLSYTFPNRSSCLAFSVVVPSAEPESVRLFLSRRPAETQICLPKPWTVRGLPIAWL